MNTVPGSDPKAPLHESGKETKKVFRGQFTAQGLEKRK
jgi:hypothetical protein